MARGWLQSPQMPSDCHQLETPALPISSPEAPSVVKSKTSTLTFVAVFLGIFSFVVILSTHHIADGDLWAKLAIGASVWLRGEVPKHDTFAFTPTLPNYIDHEWGAGVLFYGLLRACGPSSLMALKIILFLGAISFAAILARKRGASWNATLLLALPSAWSVLPAYIPTLRAHTFTFFFYAALLLLLEAIRSGQRKAAFAVPPLIWAWSSVHGGFAAGLGTIAVYAAEALIKRFAPLGGLLQSLSNEEKATDKVGFARAMLAVAILSFALTFLNPYGVDFWRYLIPALLHPRPRIAEWQPLPLWQLDPYVGFRLLCVVAAASLIFGWRGVKLKSWSGLVMLGITAYLGWRSQRHAPFFGLTALAFAAPFLQHTLARISASLKGGAASKSAFGYGVIGIHPAVAIWIAATFLPKASWDVLAPVGHDPVRECDILSRAGVHGNVATPFGWGSYASWRLYPNIKISHDGRYEAAYPEWIFDLNNNFFEKRGRDWDRLIRDWRVDFVILDLQHEQLRPADLQARGYELIWFNASTSALMALPEYTPALRKAIAELPPTTINPLDARIPERWFTAQR